MYLKAALFVAIALVASAVILLEHFSWITLAMLALVIWASCRVYYFAFYVIEHYIDGSFKYAGLWSAMQHLLRQRKGDAERERDEGGRNDAA